MAKSVVAYRKNDWIHLRERRLARKARLSLLGDHPLSHIDRYQRHQWMREDCAQYDAGRETREDNLISVVIQITSAALIAVPGLIFNVSKKFPSLGEAPLLHLGMVGLFISLSSAMVEQMLSAHAYGHQRRIAIAYYQMQSTQMSDRKFTKWTKFTRNLAYLSFILSLAISAVAIANFEDTDNGRTKTSTAATTPATAAAAPAAPAATGIQ